MNWPAQALKQTRPADGTGLAAKQQLPMKLAGLRLEAKHGQPMKLASSCRSVEVGGGSAVVLATRKAGSDLPYGLPPNLSPLPVIVYTHSLNLSNPNLAPTYFFLFLLPHYKSSPNPLYRPCSATLSCHLAYSQPLRSLPGGE